LKNSLVTAWRLLKVQSMKPWFMPLSVELFWKMIRNSLCLSF
jgi:hypothetical protein